MPTITNSRPEVYSSYCQFFSITEEGAQRIQGEVDALLNNLGYLFFPEIEWPIYGYSPHDSHLVISAWRQQSTTAAVFLFRSPVNPGHFGENYLFVQIIGHGPELEMVEKKIVQLRDRISKRAERDYLSQQAGKRFERIASKRSVTLFASVLTAAVLLLNSLTLYGRRILLKSFDIEQLNAITLTLVNVFAALSFLWLLFLFLVFALFIIKVSLLLLRRL